MAQAKHAYTKLKHSKKTSRRKDDSNLSNKSILKKLLTVIVILILIGILLGICYFGYKYYSNNRLKVNNKNTVQLHEISDIVPISESLTFKDADYLEINGIRLNSKEAELSTISSKIKNTSDETYNNIKFRIFLIDESKEVITSVDYKIDNINANATTDTHATLKRNLDNCKYYSVALKD